MKIGFIDYYLDEWHANHYPQWFKEVDSQAEVAFGYAVLDNPNGRTNRQWCEDNRVTLCATMEELVEKSDALAVLSPDNTELHEALCQVALRSGKRTYIDKTFAPDEIIGRRIFDLAAAHNTPCWSTSALRFAPEYQNIDREKIAGIVSVGPAGAETYIIHQLEPVMMLMQAPARRVIAMPGEHMYTVTIQFAGGRLAVVNGLVEGSPFRLDLAMNGAPNQVVSAQEDFFHAFIQALVRFYLTGEIPVEPKETLHIAAVRAAALRALAEPGKWVELHH